MLKHIKALKVLWPAWLTWRQALMGFGAAAMMVLAFFCGWMVKAPDAKGNTPNLGIWPTPPGTPVRLQNPGQPVAHIFRDHPITRQELGEYLIERFGAERLDFMVNHRIIEMECRRRGITVSDNEVEAQLAKDLEVMNVKDLDSFVKVVLRRFKKTLYEYKEDVIRPKLALRKLCEGRVRVTSQDLQNAFEAKFGPKVKCRMIALPATMPRKKREDIWRAVSQSGSEFRRYAKKHNMPPLDAREGEIPPIHKHFPDKNVERAAFSLQVGEVSAILAMPDGGSHVILRCEERLPAMNYVRFNEVQRQLQRIVHEQKLVKEIESYFKGLRAQANPRLFLKKTDVDKAVTARINHRLRQARADHLGASYKNLSLPPKMPAQNVPNLPAPAGGKADFPVAPIPPRAETKINGPGQGPAARIGMPKTPDGGANGARQK